MTENNDELKKMRVERVLNVMYKIALRILAKEAAQATKEVS